MVAKFDTNGGGSSESKGGNTLLYVGIALVAGYSIYRYVIKPEMDKKKLEEPKN